MRSARRRLRRADLTYHQQCRQFSVSVARTQLSIPCPETKVKWANCTNFGVKFCAICQSTSGQTKRILQLQGKDLSWSIDQLFLLRGAPAIGLARLSLYHSHRVLSIGNLNKLSTICSPKFVQNAQRSNCQNYLIILHYTKELSELSDNTSLH